MLVGVLVIGVGSDTVIDALPSAMFGVDVDMLDDVEIIIVVAAVVIGAKLDVPVSRVADVSPDLLSVLPDVMIGGVSGNGGVDVLPDINVILLAAVMASLNFFTPSSEG